MKSWAACLLVAVAAASSWLVVRADVPQVASGTWVPAGDIGAMPAGGAAVALPDGRVLVAGGSVGGVLSGTVAIYEPASGGWTAAGSLMVPRAGHAMSVLKDGRVVIAGGTAAGGPTFDIEVYNPASGTSVHAGDMTLPRVDLAAATLKDGKVLLVGGSDGVSPLSVAETFDVQSGHSFGVGGAMFSARVKATATTMLDGHVLVVGGSDGTNDLSSVEIFDATTGTFFNTGAMQTARSGHVAVLLPNNNQVLIAGGMSGSAAVPSAELYSDWRDGFSPTPNPMAAARAGGIAGGLRPYDLAFVAGGGATSGEYYGYATVKTDREDYWPGEPVTITGSGWQPGETVTLVISEDADTHHDFTYSAIADASGRISNAEFAPIENEVFHHFGKKFYLVARGAASEALNTFTDGNGTITGAIRNSVTNAVIAGATISCSNVGANPCNGIETTTSIADGTYTLTFQFPSNSNSVNITVSAPGYATQTQTLAFTNNQTRTINWLLVPSVTATTLTVAPVTGTYGGNTAAALTATLTAGGTGVSGKTVSFALNGTSVGSATTNASGVATLAAPSSLIGINVGSYPAGVTAAFTADASYSGQTASNALTLSKAQLSVKADDKSKAYDGVVFTGFTSTISGFVAGQTDAGLRASGALTGAAAYSGPGTTGVSPSVTPYVVTPTLGTLTATNYTFAFVNGSLTLGGRAIAVTADAKTKTYGDADPALTYQVTSGSLLTGDSLSGTLTHDAGASVGAYAIRQGTLTAGPNYTLTFVTANLTIGQRPASVTANAASKTYGTTDPAFSGTLSGFVAADSVTATYSRTAGETVAGSPYTVSAVLAPAGVLGNYTITYNTASFTIDRAVASVTANAASKTYGATDPTLTGALVGFLAADTVTATYSRTAGETVAGSPYTVSAVLAPAGVLGNYTITYNTASFTIDRAVASVTANAASKTYGATDPTLTGALVGFLAADTVTATYSRTAGETVGAYVISAALAPVGVLGNYDITSTTASFDIAKKTASVTAAAAGKTYGAVDPTLTGVLVGFLESDAVTASYTRTAGETVAGSPYTISAALTPAAVLVNYAITSNTATFTISKADATVSVTGYTGVFDGAAHGATGTATGVGGAVLSGLVLGDSFTNVPGGTATWTFTDTTGNYNNASASVAIVITKADATVSVTGYTGVFDGAAHGPTGTATGIGGGVLSGLVLGDSFTNVPGGTATWTFTDTTGNYTNASASVAIVITKADATVSVNGYTGVFDGNAHGATGTATGVGGVVLSGLVLGDSFTNVPGGTATWTFTDTTGNYNNASASVAIVITKADATVSVNGYTGVFDGAAHGATGTATGVGGAALSGLVLGDSFTNVPGGTATWTFTDTTGNYNNASASVAIVITKADATVSVNGYTGVFDGAAHGATGTATGVGGVVLSGLVLGDSFTNVPGGTATWTFTDTTGNYNNASASVAIVITKADATVSVNGYTGVFDGAAHGATGTATGVGGAVLSGLVLGDSFTNVPGGTATWTFTDTTGNYNNASASVAIVITKADATVSVNGYTGVFDGAAHGATGTATGVGGAALSGLVLGDSFTNVPGGTATWTFTDTTGNYNNASASVAIVITKATAVIVVTPYSVTYDAAAHTATGTATGVSGEPLAGLDLTGTTHTAAGTTSDPWTFTDVTGNYSNANSTVSDTIGKKTASVTPAAAAKTYGSADPAFSGTLSGFVASDNVTATYGRTAGYIVGAYVISATLAPVPVLGNYAITYNTASFTITKATLTVTADNKSKLLNAANPTLTAIYTGFVNGDGATAVTGTPGVTTTGVTNSPVGTYPITAAVGTLSANNYTFTYVNGTLTVLFAWDGFLQPINDTAHDLGTMSKFKTGQTIPAKFDIKDVNGAIVQQSGSPTFNYALIGAACGAAAPDTIDLVYPSSTLPIYTLNGGHYQYNWSTKGVTSGLYRIFAKLADGTTQSVDICLSK